MIRLLSRALLAFLAVCFIPIVGRGAEPEARPASRGFETTDVFRAGEGGYRTYRIPSLALTRKGTLLAVCAARLDGFNDWANIDTMLRRSTDGGKTWSPQEVVTDDGRNVVDNATFIVDPHSDTVYLLYQIGYERAYLKTSSDEGVTWSPPREITGVFDKFRDRDGFDWKVLAMGPGHGIVLKSGRFVVPVWLATQHSHRPSISATIYSDDRGETWQAGDVVVRSTDRKPNPSEHVLIELADGRVMDNIRTESKEHRRLVSYSADGATGWSEPKFDRALFDPICMASMARLEGGASTSGPQAILFANPDSSAWTKGVTKSGAWPRRNVTVRMSTDEGQTWPVARVIEPGRSGYSDIAVDREGVVYLLFERSNVTEKEGEFVPAFISLAKFDRAWLEGKRE
jgi:sialidase-1